MPGLGQQALGQVGIVLPAALVLGVVEGRGFRDGQLLQRGPTAEEGRAHQLVALHRMGDGLAHARIVEGRARPVEHQEHEGAIDGVELQRRVGRDRVHRLPGHIFDQVHIARAQRGDTQILIRIGDGADALELRQPGAMEAGEGFQFDRDAALLRLDHERPGADETSARRVPRNDRQVIGRHRDRQRRDRAFQDDAHGAVIRRLDPFHPLHLGTEIGGGPFRGDLLDRPLHIGRGHLLAILEARVAQLEFPALCTDRLPGFRQFATQRPVRRIGGEAAIDHQLDRRRRGAGIGPGLDAGRIA